MIEILRVLVEYFSFLFDYTNTKILSSKSFNKAEALIDIGCGNFDLRFIRERGQIFVEISAISYSREWFDFYLIQCIILKDDPVDFLDIRKRAAFLKDHFSELQDMFGDLQISQTMEVLKNLQRNNRNIKF